MALNGTNYIPGLPYDYGVEVSRGAVPGQKSWNKLGLNNDIDSAAAETIWTPGGRWQPLPSAQALSIVSSDGNDDSAGTGARTVIIEGLDSNRLYQSDIVTLNGTTPVITVTSWFAVNDFRVVTSGSGSVNAGIITVSGNVSATTQGEIIAGEGLSQSALLSIPANTNFYLSSVWYNCLEIAPASNPIIELSAYFHDHSSGTITRRLIAKMNTAVENTQSQDFSPIEVLSGWSVEMVASTDIDNTMVSLGFAGVEIES